MTVVDITLSHPLVNSGNDVEINGADFKYSWKNFINGDPVPGKYDTVGKTNNGFENPIITIGGLWDADVQTVLNTPATGYAVAPAVGNKIICQKLLIDFDIVRSTTPITLTIKTGQNQIPIGGRPTGGYNVAGANTLVDTLSVVIKSFDLSAGVKGSSEGQRVDYSITFVQTQ